MNRKVRNQRIQLARIVLRSKEGRTTVSIPDFPDFSDFDVRNITIKVNSKLNGRAIQIQAKKISFIFLTTLVIYPKILIKLILEICQMQLMALLPLI